MNESQNYSRVVLSELMTIVKTNSRTLSIEEHRAYYVRKNKVFNPVTLKKQWDPIFYDRLLTKIRQAKLMKFLTAEPKRFHPYLVAEFYQEAVIADDEQSFTTIVHDTTFLISHQFLVEEFGVNHLGLSINTYLDSQPGVEREHWLRWKVPECQHAFKLATPKGSLDNFSAMLLDIVLKIVIQDVGSKTELSTLKYKPIMALDDEAELDWTSYIFASLLESVHMFHAVSKSKNFCIHFDLLVSYLLEQKMLAVDRREELVDSNYLPYKNTRGKIKVQPSARIPYRLLIANLLTTIMQLNRSL